MAHRHGRHHRRRKNPVSLMSPRSWAPLLSGVVGASGGAYLPNLLWGGGATTVQAYGTQLVWGFGGAWAVRRYLDPTHGDFFLAGAVLPIAADAVRRGLGAVGVSVPGLSRYAAPNAGGRLYGSALSEQRGMGAAYYGGAGSRYYLGSSIADEGVVGPGRYQAIGAYGSGHRGPVS